jgi:hypothetical protein
LCSDGHKGEETGKTVEILGKKLGIGSATVKRGIRVRKNGTAEVIKAVAAAFTARARWPIGCDPLPG